MRNKIVSLAVSFAVAGLFCAGAVAQTYCTVSDQCPFSSPTIDHFGFTHDSCAKNYDNVFTDASAKWYGKTGMAMHTSVMCAMQVEVRPSTVGPDAADTGFQSYSFACDKNDCYSVGGYFFKNLAISTYTSGNTCPCASGSGYYVKATMWWGQSNGTDGTHPGDYQSSDSTTTSPENAP